MSITFNLYRNSDGSLDGSYPSGDKPAPVPPSSVATLFASLNTAPNAPDAIWASSQVADGNGTGTFADPYSLRGAVYNATHGKEVILKDDGVYTLTNPMNIRWDYGDTQYPDRGGGTAWDVDNPKIVTMNLQKPTQESERITVRGEQGTLPVVDCQQVRFMHMEANPFMTFRGIRFINTREVFNVQSGCDSAVFDLIHVTMTLGGDNWSPIVIQGGSENGTTTRFYAEGPGQNLPVHQNTAGLFIRNTNNWTFQHCTVHNFPLGIYYKHPNDPSVVGGTANVQGLFEDIHVYDTQRDNGNSLACNGWTFRNCLLNGAVFGATGGVGTNGQVEGGFDCVVDNVTFYENGVFFTGDGLDTGSATNVTFDNSVFAGRIEGHRYNATSNFSVASSDFNIFGTDQFYVNTVLLDFAGWKADQTSDANSVQEALTFVGTDKSNPDDWALVSPSISAGCNLTTVGATRSEV